MIDDRTASRRRGIIAALIVGGVYLIGIIVFVGSFIIAAVVNQ